MKNEAASLKEVYGYLLKDGWDNLKTWRFVEDNMLYTIAYLWLIAIIGDSLTTYVLLMEGKGIEANFIPALVFSFMGPATGLLFLNIFVIFFVILSFSTPKNKDEWIALFPGYFVLLLKLFATASNSYFVWIGFS